MCLRWDEFLTFDILIHTKVELKLIYKKNYWPIKKNLENLSFYLLILNKNQFCSFILSIQFYLKPFWKNPNLYWKNIYFRIRFVLANLINVCLRLKFVFYTSKCISIEFALPNLSLINICISKISIPAFKTIFSVQNNLLICICVFWMHKCYFVVENLVLKLSGI